MNEQDLMKKINKATEDIPIPDSISPENMKRMLDEQVGEWNTFENDNTIAKDNITSIDKSNRASNRNRTIRRFTAAACVVLCLVGGVTAIQLGNDKNMTESAYDMSSGTGNEEAKEIGDASAEESAAENTDSETFEDELVYHTSLQSPSSYDAYYDTLSAAFQEYYDSIATITNDGIAVYEDAVVESVDRAVVKESVAEESVMEDFAASDTSSQLATGLSVDTDEAASKDFSSTNTQEKDVDEGDIIKTDGTYIYKVISRFNNNTGYTDQSLTITETDNGKLKLVATIDLSELIKDKENEYLNFHEFYLYEDYIVLMYTRQDYSSDDNVTETNIVIYDIKDRAKPKIKKTLTQSGWYESSRISDGFLYTISNFNETNLDTPTPYTNYIPSVNGKTVECSSIYYPRNIMMTTTYVVTSLNLSKPTDFTDTKAIPTNGGQTYVSDSSIYFFTTLYDKVTKTEITKVHYNKGTLTPGENAIIAGYLYDSFALSEYNGYLRIVATIPANNITVLRDITPLGVSSISEDTETRDIQIKEDVNVIYILDSDMKLTGKLSGIAPGEQIYSARFMGDIGYFVTFRNVDPLFSVDLSDPTNPTILGQLKIPGFSNYLHFYEDGLLMGLGEEIDEHTSEFLGLKLSMFDISNPSDVKEQDKYIIEDSEFSEAQYNHKTIMIDPEKNILGFIYCSMDDVTYNYSYYYVTYTYDKEKGFIETAKYPIPDSSAYETNAVRGVYIGDYLYIATNQSLTSYKLGSTKPISQVYFK